MKDALVQLAQGLTRGAARRQRAQNSVIERTPHAWRRRWPQGLVVSRVSSKSWAGKNADL